MAVHEEREESDRFWCSRLPQDGHERSKDQEARRDADERAEEAGALMNRAEDARLAPPDRRELLLDASKLLRHAQKNTPALDRAVQRLRRLEEAAE